MTLDKSDLAMVTQVAATVVQEAMRNAARGDGGIRMPQSLARLGVAANQGTPGGAMAVVMDGDDESIPAVNATGNVIYGSTRVLVQFSPPQGAYVIGTLDQNAAWSGEGVLLAGEELSVARNNIEIAIPSTDFDHLLVRVAMRNTSGTDGFCRMRINGNSGASDYRYGYIESTTAGEDDGDFDDTNIVLARCPGTATTTTDWPIAECRVQHPYAADRRNSFMGRYRALAGIVRYVTVYGGVTQYTPAAVSSIQIYSDQGNFTIGSRYTVIGVGRRALTDGLNALS